MISPKHFRAECTEHGVCTITLDRPEKLNALTFAVYAELRDAFAALDGMPAVRAIVLTGTGKAFCSGGDVEDIIGQLFARDAQGLVEFTRMTGALIRNMRACRTPIVGAINGTAVGAGAVMAIACDFRVAADSAKFGFIFPRVGLCGADMGAAYLLPRIVGLGRASELLFLGDIVGADEAKAMGLVHRVVPQVDCLAEAQSLALRLASGPAFANAMTKQMLESEYTMSLDTAIEAEAQVQALCMLHADFRTAFDAAMRKEQPRFAGATLPLARDPRSRASAAAKGA
jgi:enoyl-CoA hydratase/carnithine racemase